jgi:pyrroloquinoline quinone biosynthesis protein D
MWTENAMTAQEQQPHRNCGPDAARPSSPSRMSGVQEHRLGGEMLLYVPESQTAHALNSSAVAIWELCDGTLTIDEIAEELGPRVGRSGAALLPDVILTVTRLSELGLLEAR